MELPPPEVGCDHPRSDPAAEPASELAAFSSARVSAASAIAVSAQPAHFQNSAEIRWARSSLPVSSPTGTGSARAPEAARRPLPLPPPLYTRAADETLLYELCELLQTDVDTTEAARGAHSRDSRMVSRPEALSLGSLASSAAVCSSARSRSAGSRNFVPDTAASAAAAAAAAVEASAAASVSLPGDESDENGMVERGVEAGGSCALASNVSASMASNSSISGSVGGCCR